MHDPLRGARHAVTAGRFRDALAVLSDLPEVARRSAEALLLRAMAEWRLGDFARSRTDAARARERFRAVGDADGAMRAENVTAAGAFALGDLDEAETGFSRALDTARLLRDELMVARCSNNLGNVAFYLARHDAAHGFYRLARASFERVAFDQGIAETWLNSGFVWRDRDQMDRALVAANAALEAAERADSPRVVAQAFVSRGEAIAALGDTALGRAQADRGLRLAGKQNDRLAEAEALRILGGIARGEGSTADAEQLVRDALGIATELHHPFATAELHRDLAALSLDAGRRRDAAFHFGLAEESFLKLGSVPRAEAMRRRADAVRD
ncbi:MAG TPA: tetratricopeptide repeat protein [Gemmatimonadales bacterium]